MSDIERLSELLSSGVKNKLYSGAQLYVSDPKHVVVNLCAGRTRRPEAHLAYYQPSLEVNENILFDIASLTKPLATVALVMKAVEDGRLRLDQKLVSLSGVSFPNWLLGDNIEQLLTHRTQLPAWYDFHSTMPRLDERRLTKQHFERIISQMSPRTDGKTWCYSDLGFILLGFILEALYGKSEDELFVTRISRPLKLERTLCFMPLHHCSQKNIAATCDYANGIIQGHPDDANARALSHVAGHAGLFASAKAVDTYTRALLNHTFPCQPHIIDKFLKYHHPDTPYALGWDRPSTEDSLSGRKPGDPVIGHLGFTGCSVWMDLESQRIVTLLTNRTHCNSEPSSIADLRREIHHVCWEM